ncbi:MAG: HEPN domain-containing protein [Nitrososphaerales archaeon]
MNLAKLSKDYLKRAEVRIKSAEIAYDGKYYPEVVRYAQEAVELSLKASLRSVGIEYPKEHDVGRVLRAAKERFPFWFSQEIDSLGEISSDLASKRAPSLYGIETIGKSPSDLFDELDGRKALSDAKQVFEIVKKLLVELRIV